MGMGLPTHKVPQKLGHSYHLDTSYTLSAKTHARNGATRSALPHRVGLEDPVMPYTTLLPFLHRSYSVHPGPESDPDPIAQERIELSSLGYEPSVVPFHYRARF